MKKTRRCLIAIVSIMLSILFIMPPVAKAESAVAFDINGDGEYSNQDIIYLLFNSYFPGLYPTEGNWDINNDGIISDKDVIYLLFNKFFPEQYKIINQNYSWHQCPEEIMNYIENANYSENDYSYSVIREYAPKESVLYTDKPCGFTVGDKIYYNLIPNHENRYETNGISGTLCPLDKVRWIRSTALNTRDLGGWNCDGGTVKYGLLYRGGEIIKNDKSAFVDELSVKRELNLREGETSNSQSVMGESILFYRPPIFTMYTLKNEYMYDSIKFVFDGVIKGEPVLFHCAAGADRTGTLAFILELLLGMSPGDVDKDYELTMFYWVNLERTRNNPKMYLKLVNELKAYDGETFRDKAINYVKSLGITADEINAFRAAMIDGNPEVIE